VMEDMSWEQFSAINVRAPELPGVTADMGEVRVYPHGGAFAHVIGYVAKVNKEDVEKAGPNPEAIMLHPSFRIGKQGVEKAFDADLRGKAGAQKVEVDANGREVRQDADGDIPAVPGKTVELTLDIDVQLRAEEVFGTESGAAVVMDVRNGDILCMFSGPSFDANRFVRGLTAAEYRGLAQYDHKPLFNKALTATYPPGSTFKTMVALAALEAGVDPSTTHTCSGHWYFGRDWKCDKIGGHGTLDLKGAVATSCDIYFYQTALALGPDKIAATARKFGLGEIFDIGIPGQKKGLVPDTAYKRRRFPKDPKWHPGETPSMGIGQGYTNLNPLQLCVQCSRIANGEKALHPRLIRSIGGVEQKSGAAWGDLPVDKAHIKFIRDAMAAVTTFGTAAAYGDLGLGGIRMSGKTGTAQAYSYGAGRGVYGTRGEWKLRDHAWFIGFAPQDNPRYALSVLVEHGGFGASAAAPRAREIMRTVLLKDPEIRKRIENPTPLPDLPPDVQSQDDLPDDTPDPIPAAPTKQTPA
jgi:penicillin-binding protein 2